MIRQLNVWWGSRLTGSLTQNRSGDIHFSYAPEWLADESSLPLSVSLPKRAERYGRSECRPFFGGLLPEQAQRDAAAKAVGVSVSNDFALLDALGGEVAGALSLLPAGAKPVLRSSRRGKQLDANALIRVLNQLPMRPLLAGQDGLRLSLAGAQSKVPVVVLPSGSISLPAPAQPSTHILKPPIAHLDATTENEAFAMQLAAAIGLDVAAVEARVVRGRSFLLVERFDRYNGVRLHQEDFCQALGIAPERKYASEGGPTFKDSFALVRRVTARPAAQVLKLFDAAVFNLIAGNADAHGKNFSILYTEGEARLAPLYDLLCTAAYKSVTKALAMKIGKKATLEELKVEHWAVFSKEINVSLPYVRRRVGELAQLVKEHAMPVAKRLASQKGLDGPALTRFAKLVTSRARLAVLTLQPP